MPNHNLFSTVKAAAFLLLTFPISSQADNMVSDKPLLNGKAVPFVTSFEPPYPSGTLPVPVRVIRTEAEGTFTLQIPAPDGVSVYPRSTAVAIHKEGAMVTLEARAPFRSEVRRVGLPPVFVFITAPNANPDGPGVHRVSGADVDATGTALASPAIQAQLDAARPGDTVLVPEGTYRIGTLRMRDGVRLHLEFGARLVASTDDADFPPFDAPLGHHRRAVLLFDHVKGAALTGSGTIDGQGSQQRREMSEPKKHAHVKLLHVQDSEDIRIENVFLFDAFSWTVHLLRSRNVGVRGVTVFCEIPPPNWNGAGDGWIWNNADGINPDSSQGVLIEDCFIRAGDDSIAVKNTDPTRTTSEITVRRCALWSPTRCLKIGTETKGKLMQGIVFEDCDAVQAGEALAIDLFDSAMLRNVVYRDIRVDLCPVGVNFLLKPRIEGQEQAGGIENVLLERVRLGAGPGQVRIANRYPRGIVNGLVFDDVKLGAAPLALSDIIMEGPVEPPVVKPGEN